MALRLPYPTIVGFEQVLAMLPGLVPGTRVDRHFLLGRGFPPNAIGPLLDALQFVGAVTPQGAPTAVASELERSPQAVFRRALEPVLGLLAPPYPDRKSLVAALHGQVDMTDTTLPLAATFLAWLAERASIDLVVRLRPKPGARAGVPRPHTPASVLRARVAAAHRVAPPPLAKADDFATPAVAVTAAFAGVAAGKGTATAGLAPPPVSFQFVVDRRTTREDLDRMVSEVEQALTRLQRPKR